MAEECYNLMATRRRTPDEPMVLPPMLVHGQPRFHHETKPLAHPIEAVAAHWLAHQSLTLTELGDYAGCSHTTIRRFLRAHLGAAEYEARIRLMRFGQSAVPRKIPTAAQPATRLGRYGITTWRCEQCGAVSPGTQHQCCNGHPAQWTANNPMEV